MLTPRCGDSVPVLGRPGPPNPRTPCKGHSPALPAASPPGRDWGQTPPGVWGTCVTSWDESRGGGGRGGGFLHPAESTSSTSKENVGVPSRTTFKMLRTV